MIKNNSNHELFSLAKWPMNICAFELGLGYGVGRALQLYFSPDKSPFWISLTALSVVVFCSTYVVCRYMPSDIVIDKIGQPFITIVWINITILLAICAPIISVLYYDSFLFWIAVVIITAIKALHTLEANRRKDTNFTYILKDTQESFVLGSNFKEKYVFSPNQDSYALQPLPTAIFFTGMSLGIVILVSGNNIINVIVGSILLCVCNVSYNILSGFSRANSISKIKHKATGADGA